MQDNTILVRTYTISVSTLSPIPEKDEEPRRTAVADEIAVDEEDIVTDEMYYKTPAVNSHAALSVAKAEVHDVEQAPAQVAPPRKKRLIRIAVIGATLVPLWAGWSTFVYFLILAALWPYPSTLFTNSSDALAVIALLCGLALPIITALLFLWAFSPSGVVSAVETRRQKRGNCATLWPYVLFFIGATLATLVPVAASYAALSRGGECAGLTPIATYLNAGRGGDGTAILFDGSYRFASYTLTPGGDDMFQFSNGTSPRTYSARSLETTPFVDDEGLMAMKIVSRAPLPNGCRTIKFCTLDPRERGEEAAVRIASALWGQINWAAKHC